MLQTDVSSYGIAAVLYQEIEDQRKIVSYASGSLNGDQRNYYANELECLAMVLAMGKYRPYLEDQ